MRKLKIDIETVRAAVNLGSVSPNDRSWLVLKLADKTSLSEKGDKIELDINDWPEGILRALMDQGEISYSQRGAISLRLFGTQISKIAPDKDPTEVWNANVNSPTELLNELLRLPPKNNCEYFLNGRWYACTMVLQVQGKEKYLSVSVTLMFGENRSNRGGYIFRDNFKNPDGSKGSRVVRDIMIQFGLRQPLNDPQERNTLLVLTELMRGERGVQKHVTNSVLTYVKHPIQGYTFQNISLGKPEWPKQCIVEDKLEVDEAYKSHIINKDHDTPMPFIRMFSLETKQYVFADVRDVQEYEYDKNALNRLALPEKIIKLLHRLFSTPHDLLMSDIIKGKHGGLVILASGNSGVGKTLTAEVYSEFTGKPLYKLGLAELGTSVEKVEAALQTIFERVARWNAVLLFDEVDVFLRERKEDLERSAIVGVFLRLMDYYRGVMFMTTNIPEVLDSAIRTRVTLKIEYPPLDASARMKVWKDLFRQAGINYSGSFELLAEKEYNGRVIRNLVRLTKIIHPDGQVTSEQLDDILPYGFDDSKRVTA